MSRHEVAIKIVVESNYRMTDLIKMIERKDPNGEANKAEYKIRYMKIVQCVEVEQL
ncbi:hypothetical protein [Paenibacillus guangzhouensis]|uniref:hypothetical protein n=1 Tax=Paenibacillus guangzhouensis TaxID=1473112 RepID=UPI00187B3126|nr:hypothetical protein [Paenibacillus guangzhouensis]